MKHTPKHAALTTRALCVSALMAVLAAGCGADEPSTLQSVPTTAPTTFDTTKEYAGEDRQRTGSRGVSAEEPTKESTRDEGLLSGGTEDDPLGNGEDDSYEAPPSTSTTTAPDSGSVFGSPPNATPESPIRTSGGTTVVVALPDTSEDVIGWSVTNSFTTEAHDGSVDLVFDGWDVTHQVVGEDVVANITTFFTLVGNYELKTDGASLLSFLPATMRGEESAVWAMLWMSPGTEDSIEGSYPIPVEPIWIDPTIWAPIKPGEVRSLRMEWSAPQGTEHLAVHVRDTTFLLFPHDPGTWGDSAQHPVASAYQLPSDAALTPPCQFDCSDFGLDMTSAVVDLDGRPTNSGWSFWMDIVPYPSPDQMSSTDIWLRHKGQSEPFFPSGDPWEYIVPNGGLIGVDVRMPTLEAPLYISVSLPGGQWLVWKTVAPMRNRIFSNAEWSWEAEDAQWAESRALRVVDTICWAHWSGKRDPYGLYPHPLYFSKDDRVEVTSGMVAWLVDNIC